MTCSTIMDPDPVDAAIAQPRQANGVLTVVDNSETLGLIQQAGEQIRALHAWREAVQARSVDLFTRVYEDRAVKNDQIQRLEHHLSQMAIRNADLERALSEISSDCERAVIRCMEAEIRAICAEQRASLAELCALRLEDRLLEIDGRYGIDYEG